MKPTLQQITQLFSTAASIDELSGKQDDFLSLLEPCSDECLSDDDLAFAAGGLSSLPVLPKDKK